MNTKRMRMLTIGIVIFLANNVSHISVIAGNMPSIHNHSKENQNLLLQIKEVASQGKVLTCPLSIGTEETSFPKKWRKLVKKTSESGIYSTKHGLLIEIRKGETKIHSLTYTNKKIRALTPPDLENALGKPRRINQDLRIYHYTVGDFSLGFYLEKDPCSDKVKFVSVVSNKHPIEEVTKPIVKATLTEEVTENGRDFLTTARSVRFTFQEENNNGTTALLP